MRRVSQVTPGSPASRHQIQPGDILLTINGEPVLDEIDYQALTAHRIIRLALRSQDGLDRQVELIKPLETALGLQFDDSIIGNPKTCANQCVFCFVDQMPKGMRDSLYVKDDDWRLSLLMGNYITLTNIGEREFSRILARKASPLYISVHATDPELRKRILGNKNAHLLMDRLQRLREENLSFHCQLVLCPGLNDGIHLQQSLQDLYALRPHALSVAVVPVGLTRHREGLPDISIYSQDEAQAVIAICEAFQQTALEEAGTRFVFIADEFISLAGLPLPDAETYEDFAQIENGIGMLRQFADEMEAAHQNAIAKTEETEAFYTPKTVLLPCGEAVYPYLKQWVADWIPSNCIAKVVPIINHFFGDTVTVTGLITAGDLIEQLSGIKADEVLVVETMLNSDNALFIDNKTPADIEAALGIPVTVFANNGEAFYHAMSTSRSTTETEGINP